MVTDSLIQLFLRDLEGLKREINSFKNPKNIWKTDVGINNSSGNLCLHLIGNLNHFIGAILGDSGYIREREKEFGLSSIESKKLLSEIDNTITMIQKVLTQLAVEDLEKTYPINVLGHEMKTEYFIIHLSGHLNYHLGQVNYHRRLLDIS